MARGNPGKPRKDLIGKSFGDLIVLELVKNTKVLNWKCKCKCGNFYIVSTFKLNSGLITRCKKCSNKTNIKKLKKANTRAGPRKCKRCKKIFNRSKGDRSTICSSCKERCARCNIYLTDNNIDRNCRKRNNYLCKKCVAESIRKTRDKDKQRDYDLNRNYGITLDEFEELFEFQGGVCWICSNPPKKRNLSVDHKHEPGEKRKNSKFEIRKRVRGLLCWHCNAGLQKYSDNPEMLRKAADYLEEWPAQKVLNNDRNCKS